MELDLSCASREEVDRADLNDADNREDMGKDDGKMMMVIVRKWIKMID